MKHEALTRWTTEDAAELYGIRNWGSGYFDVSPRGTVIMKPRNSTSNASIDLYEVVREIQKQDFSLPVLIRFSDIISAQIHTLNESFGKAIRESNYRNSYQGVYPIKVNQKRQVVRDIVQSGAEYHHGLEAGSKAELIAAIANQIDPEAFIICNGYKDREFVDLALYSLKMGVKTIIVIEMPGEVGLVLERSKALGITPMLGIRVKLSSRAGGHWDKSGGDRSKFGLDASQITDMLDMLRNDGALSSLRMLHYHIGSQVPDIRRIRLALQEACRFYVELVAEGAPMGVLNVGGGLAVDYDGSSTNFASSRNYSVAEYAVDVVEIITNVLNEAEVPHPVIVSESGRCITAHHSVLVFDILQARRFEPHNLPDTMPEKNNELIENLMSAKNALTPRNFQETYHDAVYYRDEIRSMFTHGHVSLRERALAERTFWHIIRQIQNIIQHHDYVPDELQGLGPAIADVYYGNFSLFQSVPDSWAIDQLFPVMPIHRLDEMPSRQAVLADITCDSDGIIDNFIDLHDVNHVLPLHEMNGEEYLLGIFLVGSYQETLGDMHNLLGKINVVHLRLKDSGEVDYVLNLPGDSVSDVLADVEYDVKKIRRRIDKIADAAVAEKRISETERTEIITAYFEGLQGYTYFEQ
ncbi:MAG: biosynthetic arginine decarboxylase [Lentisphaerae bacterium]|nr:biosynthetic arginine decarboxylase [Lentisphaerota bacterium]